jgi:hypothetical protein
MEDTEYLQAWGEGGGQPVEKPTPERVKHMKRVEDEQAEFLSAFGEDKPEDAADGQ